MFGPVGMPELVVIFLVALVLFGPKKLPELGKTIGKAITEFRRAQSEFKATLEGHMRELEKETEGIKQITSSYTNEAYNNYTEYGSSSYPYDSGAYGADSSSSTAANPPTVSEPAPQGAESQVAGETATNGTVPRNAHLESTSGQHASEPAPESHSVNS